MLMKSESVLASEMTLTIIWLSESEWVALKVRTYGSKPSEYSPGRSPGLYSAPSGLIKVFSHSLVSTPPNRKRFGEDPGRRNDDTRNREIKLLRTMRFTGCNCLYLVI